MKLSILTLSLFLIFITSCKEKKDSSSRFSKTEIIAMKEEFKKEGNVKFQGISISENEAQRLDSINNEVNSSAFLELEDGEYPSAFNDRIYPKGEGLEAYREDLSQLVGLIATKSDDSYSVGIRSYLYDNVKVIQRVPKNGKLIEKKLEKKDEKKIGWILSVELEDKQILKYSIEDQSRAIITEKNVDFEKINLVFNTELAKNKFLIVVATSTEITHSKHTSKGRRVRFSEIPLLGSAFSANSSVYVSNESMQRDYKVGLRLVPISDLIN